MPIDHRIHELTVGPDGRTAVALSDGELMSIIDLVAGRVQHVVNLGFGGRTADISPDGTVAVVCFSGEVALIDIETGRWVSRPISATIPSPGLPLPRMGTPSPHRERPVSSASGTAPPAPHLGASVRPGAPSWATVEFLPTATRSSSPPRTGAVYTWSTRPEDWIDHACSVAGRNLTDDEWRATFGDRPYHETCSASARLSRSAAVVAGCFFFLTARPVVLTRCAGITPAAHLRRGC